MRKKGKDNALLEWSPHRHKNMMLIKRLSSTNQGQACRSTRLCMEQWYITRALCIWGRARVQGGVSASGHRSFRPPGVKIDISIFEMRLNLMIKIWTPFVCQDRDKNCDYVKEASNSYSMKPTLVLLIGIHPNGVGQYYANYS